MKRVLFLDDDRGRWSRWRDAASPDGAVTDYAADAMEAIVMLVGALKHDIVYTDIHLDHDLCEEDQNKREGFKELTGYEVALWLAERPEVFPDASIVVHTLNRGDAGHYGISPAEGGGT